MCFHSQLSQTPEKLEKRFKAKIKPGTIIPNGHIHGFTYPQTPVIIQSERDLIQNFHWGLIPFWAKDQEIRKFTLNAKIETLAEKPAFRQSVNNRCLILADGFYEWQWLDPKGKKKQLYKISLPNENSFAFAGIWSEWVDKTTGEVLHSYSIITTNANALMSQIHNSKKRMPLILSPQNEHDWLNGIPHLEFAIGEVELEAKKSDGF